MYKLPANIMEDAKNTDLNTIDDRPARFSCQSCELVFTERALEYHRNKCRESDDCTCDSCVICKRDQHLNKRMPKRRKLSPTTITAFCESRLEENPEQTAFDSAINSGLKRDTNVDHDSDNLIVEKLNTQTDASSCSLQKNVLPWSQENTSTEINNSEILASNIDGETHSPNVDMQYASNRIKSSASQSINVIHNNSTCTRKLFCNTCSQHIPFDSYALHVIQHSERSEDSKFICSECSERYKKPHHLIIHSLKHYQHPFCEYCHCYYSGCADNGIQTIDEHCYHQSLRCYICYYVCNCPKSLISHMRTHLIKMPYICKRCKRGFSNKGDLKCHSEVHQIEYSNRCHFCEKTFSKQATLQSHIKSHLEPSLHQCTMCDRSFAQRGNLKRHIARHYSVEKFNSSNQNSLILNSSIDNSENVHASKNNSNFIANEVYIQDFNSIINEHSLQENIMSTVPIDSTFNEISNRKPSRRIKKSNMEVTQCSVCNEVFSCKSELKAHIRKHKFDKTYDSNTCDKRFTQRDVLGNHQATHT